MEELLLHVRQHLNIHTQVIEFATEIAWGKKDGDCGRGEHPTGAESQMWDAPPPPGSQ